MHSPAGKEEPAGGRQNVRFGKHVPAPAISKEHLGVALT
jgi:hypothetical protein